MPVSGLHTIAKVLPHIITNEKRRTNLASNFTVGTAKNLNTKES